MHIQRQNVASKAIHFMCFEPILHCQKIPFQLSARDSFTLIAVEKNSQQWQQQYTTQSKPFIRKS